MPTRAFTQSAKAAVMWVSTFHISTIIILTWYWYSPDLQDSNRFWHHGAQWPILGEWNTFYLLNLSLVKNITPKNVKVSSTAALLDGGRTGKCRTDTLQVAERRRKMLVFRCDSISSTRVEIFFWARCMFCLIALFLDKDAKNIFPSFLLHFYHFSQLRLSILVTSRLRSSVVGKS